MKVLRFSSPSRSCCSCCAASISSTIFSTLAHCSGCQSARISSCAIRHRCHIAASSRASRRLICARTCAGVSTQNRPGSTRQEAAARRAERKVFEFVALVSWCTFHRQGVPDSVGRFGLWDVSLSHSSFGRKGLGFWACRCGVSANTSGLN